jgi:hypothetical protein
MALHWKTIERLNNKIEDMVEEWHTSETTLTLAQYLRMTWEEYAAHAQNYKAIPEDWETREEGWTGEITE